VDIRESTQLTKEGKPLKMAEALESSKKQFIRTMQKDIESLKKVRSAKPSMPKADQVKKAAPPTELPVVEPSKRPVSPPFPPLRLKSAERLKREVEIRKRIEETQKRLREERMGAEITRQKTEQEKEEERKEAQEKAREQAEEIAKKEAKARKEAEEKSREAEEKFKRVRKARQQAQQKEAQEKAREEAAKRAEKEAKIRKKADKKALRKVPVRRSFKLILVIILIVGVIGSFFYWWNYLREIPPVAMHYQCQDFQCVSIEEEGEDQCLTDEDCQPVEPTVPEPLIPADETRTIELTIGQENLLPDDLKLVAVQEQTLNTFKRILAKLVSQTEKKYADLDTLISALGMSLPDSILFTAATSDVEGGNYTLYFYSQLAGNRLAIVIALAEGVDLSQELRNWEASIKTDLKAFFLGLDIEVQPTATEEFQDNIYQDIAIRYLNFPSPDLSIDYAIVDNKLVITTSRESMYAMIDALLVAPADIANWQTYRNEEYRFEVRYPKDWYLDDRLSIVHLSNYKNANSFNPGNMPDDLESIFIETKTVESDLSLDGFRPSSDEIIQLVKFEKFVTNQGVEGRRVVNYYNDHPVGYHTYIFFLSNEGVKIIFSLGVRSEDIQDIFNQILSTFNFIEQEDVMNCGEVGPDNPDPIGIVKNCVEKRFKECKPTQYTITLDLGPLGGEVTYYYEIIGPSNNLCAVKSKFLKNPNPDWVGKEMTCQYDNSKDFEAAVSDFIGKCSGPLYDLMTEGMQLTDDSDCTLSTNIIKIEALKGVHTSINASGFKGSEDDISWASRDENIAIVEPSNGKAVMVKSVGKGSTEVVVTDNAVGLDCNISILVVIK